MVQEPTVDAFTVPNGTALTFSAAPSSGTGNIFVMYMGTSAGSISPAAENRGNFKAGGIFRTNNQTLNTDTTILATENANVTGPFTVASGVTLTVEIWRDVGDAMSTLKADTIQSTGGGAGYAD